jgi:hypothetical protein
MMGRDDPCNSDAARNDRNGRVEEELMTVAHVANVALVASGRVLPQE